MTAARRQQIGAHYLDSGPLFCLGGSPLLADLFDEQLLAKATVVEAVVAEVRHNATLILPPVGPHRKRSLQQSARVVRGRYKVLLAAAKSAPVPEPPLLSAMKADLVARATANLNVGDVLHPLKNDGEAESVFWAVTESAEVISNDSDAHVLAHKYRVPSSTFVEVTRHLLKAQKVVRRSEIYRELATLSSRNIFVGEHITGELDLV